MPNKHQSTADVPYMERTRDYYRAQGYEKDYQWAHHSDSPFTRLSKPLSECKLGVVTTAMPDTETGRAQRAVYSSPVEPLPESMYTDELSWHKSMTHTKDVASFLPLPQLHYTLDSKRIGALADRFHSAPTEYSQRNTVDKDAPEILRRCQQDEVDVVLLIPL